MLRLCVIFLRSVLASRALQEGFRADPCAHKGRRSGRHRTEPASSHSTPVGSTCTGIAAQPPLAFHGLRRTLLHGRRWGGAGCGRGSRARLGGLGCWGGRVGDHRVEGAVLAIVAVAVVVPVRESSMFKVTTVVPTALGNLAILCPKTPVARGFERRCRPEPREFIGFSRAAPARAPRCRPRARADGPFKNGKAAG